MYSFILTVCPRIPGEGDDGEDASGREDDIETGSTVGPGTEQQLRPGEYLTDAIIRYGVPSINEFEQRAAAEPRFRSLVFKQAYEALVRKALTLAQNEIKCMNFIDLAKKAFDNQAVHIEFDQCLSAKESAIWIRDILEFNGIELESFCTDVFRTMDKERTKINTLVFKGPPNAGKTLIAESIAKACIFYCNIQKFSKGQSFTFMDAVGTRCCMINEPRFTDEWVETLKNVFEGCPTHVEVKFKSGQMLSRTPVIVTTNHLLSMYVQSAKDVAQKAFDARSKTYEFNTYDQLKHCKGHLNPGAWFYFAHYLIENGISVKGEEMYEELSREHMCLFDIPDHCPSPGFSD